MLLILNFIGQNRNISCNFVWNFWYCMKKLFQTGVCLLLIFGFTKSQAQVSVDMTVPGTRPTSYALMEKVVENGDTIFLDYLRDLYVYPPLVFTSKKQEKFYWRTVRDVKIALPYARLASREINELNRERYYLPNDAARHKRVKEFQDQMFHQYEKPLRKLSINQGKMIIKLIDREYGVNTYDIIKSYKGGFPAIFWNAIAKIFGSDLKMEYDGNDKDRIVERVVTLVDAGQL